MPHLHRSPKPGERRETPLTKCRPVAKPAHAWQLQDSRYLIFVFEVQHRQDGIKRKGSSSKVRLKDNPFPSRYEKNEQKLIQNSKDATPTNPRGIPYAPFVDKVEDYVTTRDDVEPTLRSFQEMISWVYNRLELWDNTCPRKPAPCSST